MAKLLSLIAISAFLVFAQDKEEDQKDDIEKTKSSAASEHASLGDFLYSYKMYEWGNFQYTRAIQMNANNEKARKKLGFKKDGEQWVKDESAKLKHRNEEKDEEKIEKYWTQYMEKIDRMGKKIGGKFASIGDKLAKKEPDKSKECYLLALEYDPDNEKIRKKAGYEKLAEEWVNSQRKDMINSLKEWSKESKGSDSNSAGIAEAGLNIKMKKRESEHLFFEASALDSDKIALCCQVGEHAFAMFKKIFKLDKNPIDKIYFVLLENPAQHAQFVEKYYEGDAEIKKKVKGMGGINPIIDKKCVSEFHSNNVETFKDVTIHMVSHWLTRATIREAPPWLQEGFAYYLTRGINGTIATHCVTFEGTGGDSDKKFKDVKKWPHLVRQWVRTGKDPAINVVIKATTVNDLDAMRTIKAWSICDFLMIEHQDKFVEFAQKLNAANMGEGKDTGEKTFKEVFNWSLDDLDAEWRKYALRNY